MNNKTDKIYFDTHENESTYYIGKASVARLNHNTDAFEVFQDFTEKEKDDMYSDMIKDREEHLNQLA